MLSNNHAQHNMEDNKENNMENNMENNTENNQKQIVRSPVIEFVDTVEAYWAILTVIGGLLNSTWFWLAFFFIVGLLGR